MTSPSESGRELRRSKRLPVMGSLREASLKIGKRKYPVELENESAGGVAVVIENPPAMWVDDVVLLQTTTGWFEVRVAHVVRVTLDTPRSAEPTKFLIGLERIREVPSPDGVKLGRWYQRLLPGMSLRQNVGGMPGMSLAALILMFPLTLGILFLSFRGSSPMAQALGLTPAGESNAGDGFSLSVAELRSKLRGVPVVESLMQPQMADAFRLTAEQSSRIGRVAETTRKALRDLERRLQTSDSQERAKRRDMILQVAHEQILQVLNDKQRERLQELAK